MKQVISCAILLLAICLGTYAQQTTTETVTGKGAKMKREKGKTKDDKAMQAMDLPYKATYSSQFAMGNPAHAKMVLDLYRDYEKNDFSRPEVFADTVTLIFSGGELIQGRDAVMSGFKQARAGVSSSRFTITAVMPIHSIDRNEDLLAVWGSQQYTATNDNKENGLQFHAIYRFNKGGKIDFVQFYEGKTATPTQQ